MEMNEIIAELQADKRDLSAKLDKVIENNQKEHQNTVKYFTVAFVTAFVAFAVTMTIAHTSIVMAMRGMVDTYFNADYDIYPEITQNQSQQQQMGDDGMQQQQTQN